MIYKREIAHVIIVCTTSDDGELSHCDPLTSNSKIIDMRGLIDDSGIIVDNTRVPRFTTTCYNTFHSYETLSFAFYFPEPRDFKCSSAVIQVKDIKHTGCIRTIRLNSWYDTKTGAFKSYEVCPDKATDRQWQAHKNVTALASKNQ